MGHFRCWIDFKLTRSLSKGTISDAPPLLRSGFASNRNILLGAHNHVGVLIQPAHIYWEHAAKTVREDFEFKRHNLLIEAKAELTKWDVFQSVFSNTKEIL